MARGFNSQQSTVVEVEGQWKVVEYSKNDTFTAGSVSVSVPVSVSGDHVYGRDIAELS